MAKPKTPRNSKKNGDATEVQVASQNTFPSSPSDGRLQAAADTKKNVIPINMEDEIRRRAYELFQERGGIPGNEHEDWVRAEREVRARYQQSA
jgi:Protein of unknown function (DUF2934)